MAIRKSIEISQLYSLKFKSLLSSFNNQHMSFKFLCIYMFFEYVRPQALYPAFDILPWAQLSLLLSLGTLFFDRTLIKTSNKMNQLFGLFCIVIVISSIMAYNPTLAWDYRNTMLGWLIVYFIITKSINSEARLILFVLAYCLFNLKMGQHGAISWISRGFTFRTYGLIGAPGWFKNSGEFAIQMLIFGSLAFALAYTLKDYLGRNKKLLLFAAASTGYITVIGASSRGSQIGLAAIALWLLAKQKNGLKGIIVLSALSLLLYYLIPDEQIQRFTQMGDDDTSLQRLAYWEVGLEVIKDNPIFGVGYNNWMPYVSYLYPDGLGVMGKVQQPHNIYIQAASELGIIGLICMIWVIYDVLVNNKSLSTGMKALWIILAIILSIIAAIIYFLVYKTNAKNKIQKFK